MTIVKIREIFKRIHKKNPISGFEWIEHGETKKYHVIGASGLYSTHKTEKSAEKAQKSLQEFYNKFNL